MAQDWDWTVKMSDAHDLDGINAFLKHRPN